MACFGTQRTDGRGGQIAPSRSWLPDGLVMTLTHRRMIGPALFLLTVAVAGSQSLLSAQAVGRTFRDCDVCPEMMVVPPGSFLMGSPDSETGRWRNEGPQHRVTIDYRFAVGVYEVTFEEWDACVRVGGCDGHEPDDEGLGSRSASSGQRGLGGGLATTPTG